MTEGWGHDPARAMPLFREQYPGFRAETYYNPAANLARMPVHAEFLAPRGYGPGAGTIIQGAADRAFHFAIEGFHKPNGAERSIDTLNGLRPHLARAASLAALVLSQRATAVVDGLQAAGAGAALIGPDGCLLAANQLFEARLADRMYERRRRLAFVDRFLQVQFEGALGQLRSGKPIVQSVAIAAAGDASAFAIHIIPLRAAARAACGTEGLLMLLADGANRAIPNADLLRCLYDLTPAEAAAARNLVEGMTLGAIASARGVGIETVRTQLRSIFNKTGARRQSDLIQILTGIAGPPLIK